MPSDPTTPTTPAASADPVAEAYDALVRALSASAIACSDARDERGFQRVLCFRAAAVAQAERWSSGEPSAAPPGRKPGRRPKAQAEA